MATKPSLGALGSSRWLRTSAGSASQASARKRSVPPSGMASRALIAMLSSADSSCPGSASTGGQDGRRVDLDADALVERAAQHVGERMQQLRRRPPRWAAAPGGARTPAACRSARRRAARRGRPRRRAAGLARPRPASGSSSSTCRLPWITVSRLLKSCAMPPVSWPTLSSRCAWLSASSDCARCRLVASRLHSDSRKRSSSSPKLLGRARERTTSAPMVRPRSDSGTASAAFRPAATIGRGHGEARLGLQSSGTITGRPCCSTKPGRVSAGWRQARADRARQAPAPRRWRARRSTQLPSQQVDHRDIGAAAPRRRWRARDRARTCGSRASTARRPSCARCSL